MISVIRSSETKTIDRFTLAPPIVLEDCAHLILRWMALLSTPESIDVLSSLRKMVADCETSPGKESKHQTQQKTHKNWFQHLDAPVFPEFFDKLGIILCKHSRSALLHLDEHGAAKLAFCNVLIHCTTATFAGNSVQTQRNEIADHVTIVFHSATPF